MILILLPLWAVTATICNLIKFLTVKGVYIALFYFCVISNQVIFCYNKVVCYKILVPYNDSALNMDIPKIFKSNKFHRQIVLHVLERKQMKREFTLESTKKGAV